MRGIRALQTYGKGLTLTRRFLYSVATGDHFVSHSRSFIPLYFVRYTD